MGLRGASSAKGPHLGEVWLPLAFLTALGRWAWGDADLGGSWETEELLPLRPLPGTEAPGTEAPQGADALRRPLPQNLLRNRSALGLGPTSKLGAGLGCYF